MNDDNENNTDLQYPIDPFMEKISLFADKVFKNWVEDGIIFEIEGELLDLPNQTIMLSRPEMLLPLILVDADSTQKEMINGSRLPFYLYQEKGSLLEYCPAVYDHLETNTMSLWTHHIDYSIEKLIERKEPNYKKKIGKEKIKISLDDLHEKFKISLESNIIDLKNSPTYSNTETPHRSIF